MLNRILLISFASSPRIISIENNHMHPDLYCPFESGLSPFVHEVDRQTYRWLQKYELLKTDKDIKLVQNGKFTWMVARMFHNADQQTLTIASELNAYLFLLDDMLDSKNGSDATYQLGNLMQSLINITTDTPYSSNPSNSIAAWRDLWEKLSTLGSHQWKTRFKASFDNAIQANIWRINMVRQSQPPSISDYMQKRPAFSGANFFAHLAEVMQNISLPLEVFNIPEVCQLVHACGESISFANDIFSYQKELLEDDEMNLVMLLKKSKQVDLHTAVQCACDIHNQKVMTFQHLAKKVLEIAPSQLISELNKYIDTLSSMMRGNIDWSLYDTARYNHSPISI